MNRVSHGYYFWPKSILYLPEYSPMETKCLSGVLEVKRWVEMFSVCWFTLWHFRLVCSNERGHWMMLYRCVGSCVCICLVCLS
jgi:hypothetical protein